MILGEEPDEEWSTKWLLSVMVVIPKLDGGLKREELKEPHRALLTRGTQEAADRYKQVEWCAALAVAEAKIQVWEQLGEVM